MENREIKFRAWDGKRMTTSGIMFNASTGCLEVPTQASFGGVLTTPYKLMQYTGLKDRNGKEIYEFDLLKTIDKTVKVVFNKGSFIVVNIDDSLIKSENGIGFTSWINSCEIIGNVFDTPELLQTN